VGKDTERLEMVLKKASKYQRTEKNTFIEDRKGLICLACGKKRRLRENFILLYRHYNVD